MVITFAPKGAISYLEGRVVYKHSVPPGLALTALALKIRVGRRL